MNATQLHPEGYQAAREAGEVVRQDGYHQPGGGPRGKPACGCDLDTGKGAYRDVSVAMPDGRSVHYYHQSPIVVVADGRYRLDSHGYRTKTTKKRLNRYLPSGYKIVQRDHEWYVETWDPDAPYHEQEKERQPFEDGMVIEP